MKHLAFLLAFIAVLAFTVSGCTEHYSNGERTGLVTQFSRTGLLFDSWEGELHVTQTGMNSTMNEFQFSIDNNNEENLKTEIATLDSANKYGWKVRLKYHECFGRNLTNSRGETDYFVDSVQVLERSMRSLFTDNNKSSSPASGRTIDTIYVVIDRSKNP